MVIKRGIKTRKRVRRSHAPMNDPESEDDSHFYHDIQTIINQSGSGYRLSRGKKRKYNHTTDFIDTLVRLGWRREYVEHTFPNLHDELIMNWPQTLLIDTLFKELIQQQGFHTNIKNSLYDLGLREDICVQLDDMLQPLLDSSYTYTQVLDNAIEYLLGVYAPLTSPTTTHPIMAEITNSWIRHTFESRTTPLYNMTLSCRSHKVNIQCQKAIKQLQHTILSSDSTFYFHATSWNGSFHIMDTIDHTIGRHCLDFGIKPGFYLTPQLTNAIKWCAKNSMKWSHETAIVIFHIPKTTLDSLSIKYLDNDNEWSGIVRESRECKQRQYEIKSIRVYDFIYGDMVSNPDAVKHGTEIPKKHNPPKIQLVGRSDRADRFLEQCIVGCIYFQKYTM